MGTEYYSKKIPDLQPFRMIEAGFCFAEAHAGTNAAALSIKTREAAWTAPRQNYCSLLTGCALYSVPAFDGHRPITLALITTQKQLSGWPVALLRQLVCSMDLALQQASPPSRQADRPAVRLTVRQRAILQYITRGMTDRQISLELCISQETVRYHKKNLYHLLNAENAVQMAVTALRLGLLSLEEAVVEAPCSGDRQLSFQSWEKTLSP